MQRAANTYEQTSLWGLFAMTSTHMVTMLPDMRPFGPSFRSDHGASNSHPHPKTLLEM